MVQYWVKEIREAKEFYEWFQNLTKMRYEEEIQEYP